MNKTASNSVSDELEEVASKVRLKLIDPLGRAIHGLKYQIKQGEKVVAQGVTDAQGKIQQFSSAIGLSLTVHVEHFVRAV